MIAPLLLLVAGRPFMGQAAIGRGTPALGLAEVTREWNAFATRSRAEVRARRLDLIPYPERASGWTDEERRAGLRQIRTAYRANRTTTIARRMATRAGRGDGTLARETVEVLLRTGHWTEARPRRGEPLRRALEFAVATNKAGEAVEASLPTREALLRATVPHLVTRRPPPTSSATSIPQVPTGGSNSSGP